MKTKLAYTVRSTRAPGETRDVIVPVIVERLNPVELETVVENCIDRGLIAGLKTTAAHTIAEGVAAQIAREFSLGRGVMFGQYFYGRAYLSGTVDSNGRVGSSNGINVRLYKGEAFKLTLSDYTMNFDGGGDSVRIESIMGSATDAGGNTHGTVVTGKPVIAQGRNFWAAGDTNKVTFAEVGAAGGTPVEVTQFTSQGPDILAFAWPGGLVAGRKYSVTVSRTDPNGIVRISGAKSVTVKAGAPAPADPPEVTGYEVDGMEGEPIAMADGPLTVKGANLAGATKIRFRYTEGGDVFHEADVTSSTDTAAGCGQVGYAGALTSGVGFLSVVTPGGESNRYGCTFAD